MRRTILIGVFLLGLLLWTMQKEGFLSQPHSNQAFVIIEPRKHKDLERVIRQFDSRMPANWDLYVFCGASSVEYAKNATKGIKRNVFLEPLDVDDLNADSYNALLKKVSFWDRIQAEDILIFQTDTALCSKSPFDITKFQAYDYIGCSVNDTSHGTENSPWLGAIFYGVGGLSFRKKSFMLKCIANKQDKAENYPEDVFFSECVHESPNKPPSAKVIAEFCTQNQFTQQSFGAHKTKLLRQEDQQKFYTFCPEGEFLKEQFKNLSD